MLHKYIFNNARTQNVVDGFLGRSLYSLLTPSIDIWSSEMGIEERDKSVIPIDLKVTENELCIKADLPGISPDSISVEVDEDVLTIEVTVENAGDVQLENHMIQERLVESTGRKITLPYPIECEGVTSTYKYGVLSINLPRVEKTSRRKILIS